MKSVAIYICVLAFVFCLSYESDGMGKCSRCLEYEEIVGSCPCCDAVLCEWCLPDAEYFFADEWDSGYDLGFEEGAIAGYEDGYADGYKTALSEK